MRNDRVEEGVWEFGWAGIGGGLEFFFAAGRRGGVPSSLTRPQQFQKVNDYIRIGEGTPGMHAIACSKLPDDDRLKDGLFVRPVVFVGATNDSRLAREEIFGPVTCVIKFKTYDEAIESANDSEYGLAATIWTRDLKTALDGAQRLEAGFVQVNQNLVVTSNLSYGG